MKLIIESESLNVCIKSKGDLNEQQVISAYQLATGDFKALFVEEVSEKESIDSDIKRHHDEENKPKKEFNFGKEEMGQVEYICPTCGHEARWNVPKRNDFVKCKECQTKIALVRAVPEDSEKETDKAGNYFIANDFFEFK